MKVIIDFNPDLIAPFIQEHLETGIPVAILISAAVGYFQTMRKFENQGNMCGYGDKTRFKNYNSEISPNGYLEEAIRDGK